MVVDQLRNNGKVQPETFDLVTVLFCEAYGLDNFVASSRSPVEVTTFFINYTWNLTRWLGDLIPTDIRLKPSAMSTS